MEEKWYQKGEICHSWAILRSGKGTKIGWYQYPNWQNQIDTGTKTNGTGTHLHNKFGTVPNIVVPIPQLPTAQIFVISHR